MIKTKFYSRLLVSLSFVMGISCSDTTEVEPRTNISSAIKGEWTLLSTQDYLCETGETTNEVLDVQDIVRNHYDFGEFEVYIEGELVEEHSGTYEVLENDYYRFTTPRETYTVKIEVSDDPNISIMYYDVDQECREVNGELRYTFTTWSRTIF
ncbi:hypothetical protein [Robiginitalea sp. SC105]|uniref:hypothetical protein n=1 Tax=Robiginitalea sp. SC105 TaxID=2762332 RepID=UPI001639A4C1|nr:hypothetical protein [Robiginitalea sp. SC105]MBC2838850.1 hypothetical protein [Robiginitalea sp. SC105]